MSVVLGVVLVFESTSLGIAVRVLRKRDRGRSVWGAMRRSKDPSVFMVVGEDVAAVLGIVIAFVGVLASSVAGTLLTTVLHRSESGRERAATRSSCAASASSRVPTAPSLTSASP
jgi:hypothetical protein